MLHLNKESMKKINWVCAYSASTLNIPSWLTNLMSIMLSERVEAKLTFMFLCLTNFPRCFCEILLVDIFSIISNGKHSGFGYDIPQVSTVETVRQLLLCI